MEFSESSPNYCFLCNESGYLLRNIQENAVDNVSFLNIIETLSGISFEDDIEFVQEICNNCQENAIMVHKFQQSCVKSIDSLLNQIEQDKFDNEFIDHSSIIEYDGSVDYVDDEVAEQNEIECEEQEIIEESIIQEEYLEVHSSPKQKDRKLQFETTNDGRFKCLKCDNSFKTKDILRRHSVRHTNDKNFKCSLCPREFFFQRDLNFHLKIHQTSEKFLCEYCQNDYSSKSALKKHLLIHKDIRLFKCDLETCGKKFRTKFALNNHMLIHTKEKPFECKIADCNQKFTQKNILIRHMISHHQVNYYECEYCKSESFEKHKDLKNHWTVCEAFLNRNL